MTDLHISSKLWESFKQGEPEAFRVFFQLHNYRIYYYLLRLLRDQGKARELTKQAFVVLFENREQVDDAEHLLRRLYLIARIGYLLRLKGKRSTVDLEEALGYVQSDAAIMDDPDIAQNETLIALETAMQKLPPAKREVAELYFFQALSIGAVARQMGIDKQSVKESLSQSLKRLGEDLFRKREDRKYPTG